MFRLHHFCEEKCILVHSETEDCSHRSYYPWRKQIGLGIRVDNHAEDCA